MVSLRAVEEIRTVCHRFALSFSWLLLVVSYSNTINTQLEQPPTVPFVSSIFQSPCSPPDHRMDILTFRSHIMSTRVSPCCPGGSRTVYSCQIRELFALASLACSSYLPHPPVSPIAFRMHSLCCPRRSGPELAVAFSSSSPRLFVYFLLVLLILSIISRTSAAMCVLIQMAFVIKCARNDELLPSMPFLLDMV